MAFDVEKARAAGYSDGEIQQFLLGQKGVSEARQAGYSDGEILQHFGFAPAKAPTGEGQAALEGSPAVSGSPAGEPSPVAHLGQVVANRGIQGMANTIAPLAAAYSMPGAMGELPAPDATQGISQGQAENALSVAVPWKGVQANGPLERYAGAAAQGIGQALPVAPLAGAILPQLAIGATGGLGAQAGKDIAPSSEYAPLLGGLAGGLAGGAGVNLVTRAANALTGNINPNAQALLHAGLPLDSPALAAEAGGMQKALGPYVKQQDVMDQLGNGIERAAQATGGEARTWEQAGDSAKSAAQKWLQETLPATLEGVWAPVRDAVPPSTPTPITNFTSAVEGLNKKAGALQNVYELLTPQLPKALQGALQVQELGNITPSWSDVQTLRSAVGEAIANPQTVKDIPQQALSKLYSALSEDMRGTIGDVGGQPALDQFAQANAESQRLYNIAEGPVSKLVTSDEPGKVARALATGSRADASQLQALRDEVPDAADNLASAHLRQIGLASPELAESSLAGNFNKSWHQMSPEAKIALVPDAGLRTQLDGTAVVHGNLKSLPANTEGKTLMSRLASGGLGSGIGALSGSLLGHSPEMGAVVGMGAGEALGNLAPWVQEAILSRAQNGLLSPVLANLLAGKASSLGAGQSAGLGLLAGGKQ